MKKITFLLSLLTITSVASAQTVLLNYDNSADYTVGSTHGGGPTTTAEVTGFTGDAADKALEVTHPTGQAWWSADRYTLTTGSIDTSTGLFFSIDFRSEKANGVITLKFNDGGNEIDVPYTNGAIQGDGFGPWLRAVFDMSAAPALNAPATGTKTTFDIFFDVRAFGNENSGTNNEVNVQADEKYILDNLMQGSTAAQLGGSANGSHTLNVLNAEAIGVSAYFDNKTATLSVKTKENLESVTIYSTSGAVISSTTKINSKNSLIALSNLSKGLYIAKLETVLGKNATLKFVK